MREYLAGHRFLCKVGLRRLTVRREHFERASSRRFRVLLRFKLFALDGMSSHCDDAVAFRWIEKYGKSMWLTYGVSAGLRMDIFDAIKWNVSRLTYNRSPDIVICQPSKAQTRASYISIRKNFDKYLNSYSRLFQRTAARLSMLTCSCVRFPRALSGSSKSAYRYTNSRTLTFCWRNRTIYDLPTGYM
jgi:hypothetical protein